LGIQNVIECGIFTEVVVEACQLRYSETAVNNLVWLFNILDVERRTVFENDLVDKVKEVSVVNNKAFDIALVDLHTLTDLPNNILNAFIFRFDSNDDPVV